MHSVLKKEVEVFEKETLAQHLSIVLKMLLPGKKGFTKLSYYYELHLYANSSVCYNVTVQYLLALADWRDEQDRETHEKYSRQV